MNTIIEQIKNDFFSNRKDDAYLAALNLIEDESRCINDIPAEMRTTEFYLSAVRVNECVLEYIPNEFKTYEFYLAAVVNNPNLFEYVPGEFKTEELMIAMVKNGGPRKVSYGIHKHGNSAVLCINPELLNERIVIEAMKANGYMMESLLRDHPEFQTRDVCMAAVMNAADVIPDVPDHILDKRFLIDAVKHNWKIIKHLDYEYMDSDIYLRALAQSPKAVKYIPYHYLE